MKAKTFHRKFDSGQNVTEYLRPRSLRMLRKITHYRLDELIVCRNWHLASALATSL